ncbi:d-isomer specific 2-hydroxyacid dehydrogenase [Colletotrichum truncatum]|uniref:D-isomer specific 2-hydroxyacid dehydrogenase n=1 Tax=Colletotrichum truncatum TaxID=5467 RepID=A0ACC3YE20_COLTU|nr:d-isomer specific 2-hydroxyacid dehydrogenase [Colletotrichum truncatum]KAF6790191.1 d-isomer specific 2-hydroxyacid dehydrogenase [Colletotrichum truncatum]
MPYNRSPVAATTRHTTAAVSVAVPANPTKGFNGTNGTNGVHGIGTHAKLKVLQIGGPVKYSLESYNVFSSRFEVIHLSTSERQRPALITGLRDRKWGDFSAIFRPSWGSGGEMGRWDSELISLLPPSCRVFASAGSGFDWADTKLLGERGIIYCNSGPAAADAVADFAVALTVSTFRHLQWCITASPDATTFQDCHGRIAPFSHNLRGRALGIIGFGNIGKQIAQRLGAGFGMIIHYHNLNRKDPATEALYGATFHPTLKSLLSISDCVVLCIPGGQCIITAESLAWFKPGARFVNIARGSLVDEDALADALESGHLSNVALDVHMDEPRPSPRLLKLSGTRATLTCHNAGCTVETHASFEELSMRNIMAVLSGKQSISPVNLHYLKK